MWERVHFSEYLKIPGRGAALGQLGSQPGDQVSVTSAGLHPSLSLRWHLAGSAQKRKPCPGQWVPPTKDPAGAGTPSQENCRLTLPIPSLPPLLHSTSVLDHQPSSSLLDLPGGPGLQDRREEGFPRAPSSLADSLLLQAAFLCLQEAASQGLLTREPLRVSGKPLKGAHRLSYSIS